MKQSKKEIQQQQRQEQLAEKGRKKLVRHNTAANQEKHRHDWQPLKPNEIGVVADRRVMPRDEQSRRDRVEWLSAQAIAADYDDARWQAMAEERGFPLGIVVEVSRGLCRVSLNGTVFVCDWRGTLIAEDTGFTNVLAVGDRVLVTTPTAGHGFVTEVLPRRSGLARADTFHTHLKQVLAANVDQVLVVAAWREPHLWLQLVDEYLIGAARNNLSVIICLNKVDLAEEREEVAELLQPYAELGHRLLFTSAVTGEGLAELTAVIRHKTTVLAGLSGVGKSTLLNAVDPGLHLRTGEVTHMKSKEGRHTTTQATMLPLPQLGGFVVDTPGIKDMGLIGLEAEDLLTYYPEIAPFVLLCRFKNCRHETEPGCMVVAAVEDGRIAPWRLDNYQNLYQRLALENEK